MHSGSTKMLKMSIIIIIIMIIIIIKNACKAMAARESALSFDGILRG